MLIGCIVLHLIICRIFKIKYEYVILSMVGCIVDGPTSSLTAAGADWKSLINVGLIMGVIAGACGNYVGIFVSYVIKVYAACKHDERRKPQTNSGACDPRCRSFAIFSDNMFTVGFFL